MRDAIKTIVKNGFVGKIFYDDSPESPRTSIDNLGKIYVPDRCDCLNTECDEEYMKTSVIKLPLYVYEHSGITISTKPFSCRWDSGQVGWYCLSREDLLKCYGGKIATKAIKERAISCMVAEIEELDQYFRGDIYGYTVEKDGEDVDSCWGYYGEEYATEELEYTMKFYIERELEDRVRESNLC